MDELGRFNGALLVISHDIKLLDRAITRCSTWPTPPAGV